MFPGAFFLETKNPKKTVLIIEGEERSGEIPGENFWFCGERRALGVAARVQFESN